MRKKRAPLLSAEALNVFETLPDLYLILSPELVILTASDAYLAHALRLRADLVGKSPREAFPAPAGTAEGETMQSLAASLEQVLATKAPHRMEIRRDDLPGPGGRPLTRYWQPLNTPVLDAQGAIRYIIHKVEECTPPVTHKKQAQARRRIKESELLASSTEAVARTGSYQAEIATMTFRFSDGLYRLFGEEPQSFAPTLDFIDARSHPDDVPVIRQILEKSVIDKTPYEYTRRIYTKAGALSILEAHGTVVCDKAGNAVKLLGLVQDVTRRHRTEAALQDAYRRLAASNATIRQMLDGSMAAICLLDARRNGEGNIIDFIFRGANQASERINRKTEGELSGRGLLEMFPGVKEVFFADYVRVVETGEPLRTERYYDSEHYDHWFDVSAVKNGEGFIMTYLDITDRKRAEEAVRKNFALLQQSEALARMGSWEYDLATEAFSWSEGMYRLFGLPAGSPVRPQIYLDFVLAADRPLAETFVGQLLRGQQTAGETLRIRVDGAVRTLKLKSLPLRNGAGRPTKLLGVDLDISEVKRLEAENLETQLNQQKLLLNAILEAQEQERRRISESLHNGVGQILFATRLNLNQLEMNFKASRAQGVQEGLRATEALLTEAINQTRRASYELVPVLLKNYGLGAAIADFSARFAGTGIAFAGYGIRERLPDQLEMAVYRIAQELAGNILRHSGATRARIEVTSDKDTLLIEAHDNGKGMDAANPGTGFGLKTIADRVALLNGKVEVESAPGKGTLVTVLLPLPANGEPRQE